MKKVTFLFISILFASNIYSQYEDCDNLDRIGQPLKTEDPAAPDIPTTVYCPPDCPPSPPTIREEDERLVFWIHGFGGDHLALSNVMNISSDFQPHPNGGYINDSIDYSPRKIKSFAPGYDTGETLLTYGNQIGQYIECKSVEQNQTLTESKMNICITSSWGGNVARMAERVKNGSGNSGFRAGGIISLGGSHDGAVLADNIITTASAEDAASTSFSIFDGTSQGDLRATEKLNDFLNNAFNSLLEGPENEVVANRPILNRFGDGLSGIVDIFVDELVDLIPRTIGTSLFSRTALNLHTTDPTQISLQNSPGQTFNIAAYGVEDYELGMWRLFYWGKTNPNNIPTSLPSHSPNGQGFFEATSDKFAEDVFNKNLANYQMKVNEMDTQIQNWKSEAKKCAFNPSYFLTNISNCLSANTTIENFEKAKAGYERGVRWYENSSDFWELLTGALYFEQESGTCHCVDNNVSYTFPCQSIEDLTNTSCGESSYFTPGSFIEKRRESDGVVLASSAANFPGAIKTYRMDNSNHFQLRNDNNIGAILKELFNGVEPPEAEINFFKTEEKTQ